MLGKVAIVVCVTFVVCSLTESQKVQQRSFFGLFNGITCNGCPARYCDDDPAIILGYCCGCAGYFERLPVQCSPYLQCPANNYELCQQYNYMRYCCCAK